MRIPRIAAVLVIALALVGCGEPELDSRDLEDSIAELRDSVESKAEKVSFDEAMAVVREASTGGISGTEAFSLDGMTVSAVLAEAARIGVRREMELLRETVAAQEELLQSEERLARLQILGFRAELTESGRVLASMQLVNGLESAVDSGWLHVEAELTDGTVYSGEEYVAIDPPLPPEGNRTLSFVLAGDEAFAFSSEARPKVEHRFVSAFLGSEPLAEAPTLRLRERAEAARDEAQSRLAELEARLREL